MNTFLSNILLALAWTAVMGDMTPATFGQGFVLGYVILMFSQPFLGRSTYFRKVWQIMRFGIFFARELIESNIRVAFMVIRGADAIRPGIVAFPLDAKTDLEITFLANFITFTPGTLSLDVSEDKRTLYIHALYIDDPDALRQSIKQGLERRMLEVLR